MLPHHIVRRHFWVALAPLAALAAFLNVRAISSLVLARLAPEADALAASPPLPPAPPAPAPSHVQDASAIVARNPFDHTTSLRPPPEEKSAETSAQALDPRDAPACAGVNVRVITASTDPEWSFAGLSAGEDPQVVLTRRGGTVGNKTVHFVGWDRVWLSESGALCQSELFRSGEDPKPPQLANPKVKEAPAPSLTPEIARGIVRLSATEFALDRGVLEMVLENQQSLVGRTRVQPESIAGRVVGVRLLGIKPGALLGALGFEDGDRLDTLNGFEVANPESALAAYARLRGADHVRAEVNRAGKPLTLEFTIR